MKNFDFLVQVQVSATILKRGDNKDNTQTALNSNEIREVWGVGHGLDASSMTQDR